jgi:hypothetical protein
LARLKANRLSIADFGEDYPSHRAVEFDNTNDRIDPNKDFSKIPGVKWL